MRTPTGDQRDRLRSAEIWLHLLVSRRDLTGMLTKMGETLNHPPMALIKASWEAIFRVTDDFYLMKGGVRLYIT